jgi:hypothetical protein
VIANTVARNVTTTKIVNFDYAGIVRVECEFNIVAISCFCFYKLYRFFANVNERFECFCGLLVFWWKIRELERDEIWSIHFDLDLCAIHLQMLVSMQEN